MAAFNLLANERDNFTYLVENVLPKTFKKGEKTKLQQCSIELRRRGYQKGEGEELCLYVNADKWNAGVLNKNDYICKHCG